MFVINREGIYEIRHTALVKERITRKTRALLGELGCVAGMIHTSSLGSEDQDELIH